MRSIDLVGGTEIVSEAACWEMLGTQSVGRLAVSMDGQIDVFPVNYRLDGNAILFRTNAGRKMSWAARGEVAFEVDFVDVAGRSGWSVVVHASAVHIEPIDAVDEAEQSWTGPKDLLVRITPRSVTGRRVHARPGWI